MGDAREKVDSAEARVTSSSSPMLAPHCPCCGPLSASAATGGSPDEQLSALEASLRCVPALPPALSPAMNVLSGQDSGPQLIDDTPGQLSLHTLLTVSGAAKLSKKLHAHMFGSHVLVHSCVKGEPPPFVMRCFWAKSPPPKQSGNLQCSPVTSVSAQLIGLVFA